MEKKLKVSLIVNVVLVGILLGLVLNSTLFVEPMFVEVTVNHNELQPWLSDNCDYNELVFINKTSTILDEPWDGQYTTNFLGVPDDLTVENVQKCMNDITEKRKNQNIESEPEYNIAPTESKYYQETKDHLPTINLKNEWIDPEPESKQEFEMTFDYVIESNNATYGSQYQISGGTVDEITYNSHSNSLIISLNESEKGHIQIVIQTGLLHSLNQLPFNYFVIVDGEEVIFEQLSPIILKIPFEKDTQKIEIIGTFW